MIPASLKPIPPLLAVMGVPVLLAMAVLLLRLLLH